MTRLCFSSRSTARWAAAGLLLLATTPPLLAQSASEIYTCIDARGRKLTSDRRIPECNDREQKILNPSGTVKSIVGPALTAQERLLIEAKNKAVLVERARQEEDKKRDRALLIRYPNEVTHQKERAKAIEQITLVKLAAAKREAHLQDERKKLQDEVAFYANNPSKVPAKLRRQMDEVTQSLAAQARFITEKDLEAGRTNARFDEELLRLAPLWRANTSQTND
jgi:hypothetical protein